MSIDRRNFIGAATGAAVGAVALSKLPTQTSSDAAMEPVAATAAAGNITDVKHIVVIMQENRSFDHYFGTLNGVRGFDDQATILLSGGNSVFNQPNGSGRQYPWKMNPGTGTDLNSQCDGGLAHSWTSMHAAWNGGKMDNWVAGVGNVRSLGYLRRNDIAFHYALADNYTICDAYHASSLTGTGPNRLHLWTGKNTEATKNGGDFRGWKLTWKTYAEELQAAGIDWKVYQVTDPLSNDDPRNYGDNALEFFAAFRDPANDPGSGPLWDRGVKGVDDSVPGTVADKIVAALEKDVLAGTLPQVSWIVPDYEHSEHPMATPGAGAHFLHRVLDALNKNAGVLNSTVVFINYDENDGYYDHVPPPIPPAQYTDEFFSGVPLGMGFRVPMIIVSPWSKGGWVDSQVYDHSSVIRFMEKWSQAIGKPAVCTNITPWRRKVAGDLTAAFDFSSPSYGMPSLPSTSHIGVSVCSGRPNPSPTSNSQPVQESGTRRARALPYQPAGFLDGHEISGSTMRVYVKMLNEGGPATRAAHYAIYANAHRTDGPWQYTVDANSTERDFFNCGSGYGDGKYDLTLIGPNRFLRRFQGDLTKAGRAVAVTTSYRVESGTGKLALWFKMTNNSQQQVTFTVKSTRYRSGTWTYNVPAGGSTEDYFNQVHYSNGWYDFDLTISSDTTWRQRFTGHLETGSSSITG